MKNLAEHIWMGPWPELIPITVPGRFDLVLNVGDSPCDVTELRNPGGVLRHMWIPVMGIGKLDYSPFYAVNRILDAYRGKQVLVYSDPKGKVPLPVWSWIVREELSGSALPQYPEIREAMNAEWDRQVFLSASGDGRLPPKLAEFLLTARECPDESIESILRTDFAEIAFAIDRAGTEIKPKSEPEPEPIPEEDSPEGPGTFLFTCASPYGVTVGLVSSDINLAETVHGRAHSQSRLAMGRFLGLDYEPRKGERLEVTGPWNPGSRFLSEEEWEVAYAEAECKHKERASD